MGKGGNINTSSNVLVLKNENVSYFVKWLLIGISKEWAEESGNIPYFGVI